MSEDQMLPPWVKFPDVNREGRDDIDWVQEPERTYWHKWAQWYMGLNRESRSQYRTMYPVPKEWPRTYKHFEKLLGISLE